MKNLLLITSLSIGLTLPPNVTSPPVVELGRINSIPEPTPVIGIIPGAIIVGVGVGVVGIGAIKIGQAIMRAWEHRVTNSPVPEVVFTFAEDEYP